MITLKKITQLNTRGRLVNDSRVGLDTMLLVIEHKY